MANLIQKVKLKTPELIAIKWDGDGVSAYEIKSMLANHHVGVFYIATDDWHPSLTPDESQGLVYYDPFLVINAGRREVRLEKDQYLVLNPEASNMEPKVTIMSEEELREYYELYKTKQEESNDNVLDEQDSPEAGPILHEPVPEESPEKAPIIFEPVPQPEEEVVDDNPSDDDQAEGSDYRAVEDLAGHGDGELRERDSLGGESGEPSPEDDADV